MDKMLFSSVTICVIVCSIVTGFKYPVPDRSANKDWFAAGQDELRDALNLVQNTNMARNVILFLGDGMSLNTIWSGRIYIGQYKFGQSGEEYELEIQKFPHVGLSKTYLVDKQIPDSAGTATAYLCGVKANDATIGVNSNVKRTNCSNQADNTVTSILDWSMEAGKATGIITTARITHATPGAAYAHSADRTWENDAAMNKTQRGVPAWYNQQFGCKDIALQLVEDNPNINVLLGGGRASFRSSNAIDEEYPSMYQRLDDRDLIQEWMDEKNNRGVSNAFVWNKQQFDAVDPSSTDYLFGLFEPSHMQYELDRDANAEPSIAEMTRKAIEILQKDNDGFFLFVESGRIDHAHHNSLARKALEDLYALDEAVKVAKEMTSTEDTLIIVTADHSHSFTSSGYTSRGLDILGFADGWDLQAPLDELPFTTLVYGNGPGVLPGQPRANLTDVDTTDVNYVQQAAVPTEYETHGGEDVAIYASGPMAHLFHKTHEQNYIAHVMAYASCVGDNREHCDVKPDSDSAIFVRSSLVFILLLSMISQILI